MFYKIFVTDENGGITLMELPFDLKMDYINRFGTEQITTITEYESWLEELIVFSKIEKLNK
jgi:hypothetical protein